MKWYKNSIGYVFFLLLSFINLSIFLVLFTLSSHVFRFGSLSYEVPWVPDFDINFHFRLDGLSLLFSLLITGVGSVVFLYSADYFKKNPQNFRISLLLGLFCFAMVFLVVADNLITFFMFWELTTFTSYFLIGTHYEKEKSRDLALQALIVTGAGGLAFLAGILLLGHAAGTYQISSIVTQDLSQHALYTGIFILLMLGCFTKSAQCPFHFWLPNAMAAPTPISAYLHSATMVKAGIYFLARFHSCLGGTTLWFSVLVIVGGATAVGSSIQALRQTDLKAMMAYTTLTALGTLTALLGINSPMAWTAAMTLLVVHALYKSALFLTVGNIEKMFETREWPKLHTLAKSMPVTALTAIFSALSMSGMPFFFGFIGKELTYKTALETQSLLLIMAFVGSSILISGISFFIILRFFTGSAFPTPKKSRLPFFMIWPVFVLGISSLIFGLVPGSCVQNSIHSAVRAISPGAQPISLQLWYGWDYPVVLSVMTLLCGYGLARHFMKMHGLMMPHKRFGVSFENIYTFLMDCILSFARWQTRILQNGHQRYYIMVTFLTLTFLASLVFLTDGIRVPKIFQDSLTFPFYQIFLLIIISLSTLITSLSRSRLLSICALGVVGLTSSILFAVFSAPDVAMTQFMIEILVVIIMTTIMLRLPVFVQKMSCGKIVKFCEALTAFSIGSLVFYNLLHIMHLPFPSGLKDFFEQYSYPKAFGRNIVNVILVDFRALDTLGELLVVTISGLACLALIQLRKPRIEAKS